MKTGSDFYSLTIAPSILEVLAKLGFKVPTPIQERSIPPALEGKDLIGIAQTGTGKTLAFGIPMIQYALQSKGNGLIILPTRELGIQVHETLRLIGQPLGVKSILLIGGAPMGKQVSELRRGANIVIGTPGRILDHMQHRTLSLASAKMLVLDEADRMLDMGFAPQLKRILAGVPKERQTLLFSATMPHEIVQMANSLMKLPVQIEIAPPGTAAANVTHEVFMVGREQKTALLQKLLGDYKGSILVFTRTKFAARKVARDVRNAGHTAAEIHSNRSLNQRKEALGGFKNGTYRVLVATDIAARGIDVTGIEVVINYDLPGQAEDYVHRIGRTGRAGASGHAISFATPDQKDDLRHIERLLRTTLPMGKLPESLPAPSQTVTSYRPFTDRQERRPYGRSSRPSFGQRRSGGGGGRPGGSGGYRQRRFGR